MDDLRTNLNWNDQSQKKRFHALKSRNFGTRHFPYVEMELVKKHHSMLECSSYCSWKLQIAVVAFHEAVAVVAAA